MFHILAVLYAKRNNMARFACRAIPPRHECRGLSRRTVTIAERLSSTKVVSIDRREPSQLDLHLAHFKRQPGAYLAEQARSIRFCVQMGMRGLPLSGRWAEAGKVAWIAVSMWYHWLALAVAALCPASRRWEARHINRLLALMEPMAA